MTKVSSYFQRIRKKIKRDGVYNSVMQSCLRFENVWFDAIYGVDTYRTIPLSALNISSPNIDHGIQYQPILINHLKEILEILGPTPDDVLVDFGSGKGNVLLVSSTYPFKRVVGVEFSDRLCAIADKNVSKFRGPKQCKIQINCIDAGDYLIKNDETIFYFFNPFDRVIMRKVLENINFSLSEYPRRVRIVYYNLRSHDLESGLREFELVTDSTFHGIAFQIYQTRCG